MSLLLLCYEACKYGNLQEFLELCYRKLSTNVRRFFISEIGDILQYLHIKEIVHRDIKVDKNKYSPAILSLINKATSS
jgi:serine/threonine protein kinase